MISAVSKVREVSLVVYSGKRFVVVEQVQFWVEMGKNPRCLGSVLFGFYDYQGSVRFEFLLSL